MRIGLASVWGVAGIVIAATASAQSALSIYGRLNLAIESVQTRSGTAAAPAERPSQVPASAYTGINVGSVSRVTSNGSLFGLRGTEALGDGLKLIWQVESSINADSGSGTLAGRNTFVGLAGPSGSLILGNYDTPYKTITIPFGAFYAPTSFDYFDILGNPGFAAPVTANSSGPSGTNTDASFDRRQGNTVQYWTPRWKGLSGRVSWSTGELSARSHAYIWSASLTYENGPIVVKYAYERHNDYFGLGTIGGGGFGTGNTSSKDQGHKLVAEYLLATTRLRAAFERLDYHNDDTVVGRIGEYKRNAWWLQVEQPIGSGRLIAAYGQAADGSCSIIGGAGCLTGGLGAKQMGLGYLYDLSKRTALYAYYTRVKNDESAQYGVITPVSTAPGITTNFASIGINHGF